MRIKDPRPKDPKCSSQTGSNQHQQGTCLKCYFSGPIPHLLIKSSGGGPGNLCFNKSSQMILMCIEVWEPLLSRYNINLLSSQPKENIFFSPNSLQEPTWWKGHMADYVSCLDHGGNKRKTRFPYQQPTGWVNSAKICSNASDLTDVSSYSSHRPH